MEKVFKKESFSAEDTFAIGKELAEQAKPGEVYCLYGDLGCGKTVFSQGFGAGLGVTEPISSPTFTILIEWAELIYDILPPQYKKVTIKKDIEKGFDYRTVLIEEITR